MSAKNTKNDYNVADGEDAVERNFLALVHLQIPTQDSWKRGSESILMNGQSLPQVLFATALTCIVDKIPLATISAPSSRHSY